ncbi:hypothetical protein TNCV_1985471 [Trichonephila clavipes]|nr:hypothetical protein TNCV_1985471 [Trichonephila clavipes]
MERLISEENLNLLSVRIGERLNTIKRHYLPTNENKIDRERQRAGASAHNEWRRGTEANMRSPKMGRGGATRGGKANQQEELQKKGNMVQNK